MSTIVTDVAIIGAGPGGYVAAIHAARIGMKVVLIEKGTLGGVCLNLGCIPTKSMIHQASIYHSVKKSEELGIRADYSGFSFGQVFAKSREVADRLSRGVAHLLKKSGVQVIEGTGYLLEDKMVRVRGRHGDEHLVKSQHIIIATGSRPKGIPAFAFDGEVVLCSNDALMLEELPKSMIILGAGAIGCEFAHIFSSFGVEIHLIELLSHILPNEDPDTAGVLASVFKKRGIQVFTQTRAVRLENHTTSVSLEIVDGEGKRSVLQAEKMLVSTGRQPNTEGLGLEALGIAVERGFIKTADYYVTSVPGVYAIGDVIASPLLAHVASKEGELVIDHIAGREVPAKIDGNLTPSAIYTEPQVASFGLTKAKAREKGIDAVEVKFPFSGSGMALATDSPEGMVKIVYEKETKEILGSHVAGSKATELIHELLLAAKAELLPEDIASMMHAHPTFSESVMEAARMVDGHAIHGL